MGNNYSREAVKKRSAEEKVEKAEKLLKEMQEGNYSPMEIHAQEIHVQRLKLKKEEINRKKDLEIERQLRQDESEKHKEQTRMLTESLANQKETFEQELSDQKAAFKEKEREYELSLEKERTLREQGEARLARQERMEREKLNEKQIIFDEILQTLKLNNSELSAKQLELQQALSASEVEQSEKLREMQAKHDEVTKQIQEQHEIALETYKNTSKAEIDHLKRSLERKNYESYFAKPSFIRIHEVRHPNAFNIQVVGSRGVGKSLFINHLLREFKIDERAATGEEEKTTEPRFFDLTEKVAKVPPFKEVFILDQPGIGGQKITEANYLHKYGPGHFDITFLLTKDGFNEIEVKLLRHLTHNKCKLIVVRTFCGVSTDNIREDAYDQGVELTPEEAFEKLTVNFKKYMEETVKTIDENGLENPVLFLGRRRKNYPDFWEIKHKIETGQLIDQVMPGLRDSNSDDEQSMVSVESQTTEVIVEKPKVD